MAIIRTNTGFLREVLEKDYWGERVKPGREKFWPFSVSNELSTEHGTLGFQCVISIAREAASSGKEAEALCAGWCAAGFPSYFSHLGYWNFFEIRRIEPSGEIVPAADAYQRHEEKINLSGSLAKAFVEAREHVTNVRQKFEANCHRLRELVFNSTAFGFSSSLSEARQLFWSIERVLECSADLGGYGPSNIRAALRDYEELARRKVENNHTYQVTLRGLQTVVSGLHFPSYWGQKPVA